MSIKNGILKLEPRPIGAQPNLPIDHFFESLANDCGGQVIGVVLSGSASDGSRGIMTLKDAGGITFAQDEKTAQFDMMPRNAVLTECVDFVLTPEAIAKKINEIASHPFVNFVDNKPGEVDQDEASYRRILTMLRTFSGSDFNQYKSGTLKRRITRRMVLNRVESFAEYIVILEKNTKEMEILHQDVLIRVTRFSEILRSSRP